MRRWSRCRDDGYIDFPFCVLVPSRCRFRLFFDAFWRPLWVLRASLGVLWGSFGSPLGALLGSLGVLLAAVGCLGVSLGVPGSSWDVPGRLGCDFSDFPRNSRRSFGSIFIFGGFWEHFGAQKPFQIR